MESHIGAVPVSEAKEIVMGLEKLASEVACLKQSLGKDDLGMPNAIIFQRLIKIADRQFPVCLFMEWKRLIAGKLAELVIKAVDVLIERVDERSCGSMLTQPPSANRLALRWRWGPVLAPVFPETATTFPAST